MQTPDLSLSKQIYEEAKWWIPAITTLWFIFKGFNWVKDLKENHLKHIQDGIADFNIKLDKGLETQTERIVYASGANTNEIKELRGDVKMLTSAILNQTAMKAAARKRKKA